MSQSGESDIYRRRKKQAVAIRSKAERQLEMVEIMSKFWTGLQGKQFIQRDVQGVLADMAAELKKISESVA